MRWNMEKALASKIQLGIYIEEVQSEKSTKYNLPFLVKLSDDISTTLRVQKYNIFTIFAL